MLIALLRHGPTAWTEEGRIQGWTDIPLSAAGRDTVRRWRVPVEFGTFIWISSPLRRALGTAAVLGIQAAKEPRIKEMHWGEWEGHRIAELRRRLGCPMAENEDRGLDFRPPGGESPRDLQERLRPWLAEVGRSKSPVAAVCHNGVIRAVLALATGWDMRCDAPLKIQDAAIHVFRIDMDGMPHLDRPNIPMELPCHRRT